MESRFQIFIAELKRRKVTRVAFAYGVVGFIVWQAAEIALPAVGLPDEALTLVVIMTVLGFPIALVLSWAYELRPEEPREAVGTSREALLTNTPRVSPSLAVGAPTTEPAQVIAVPAATTAPPPAPVRTGPFRVLIVDDDEDVRVAVSALVGQLGYEAETAVDGIEGLAKLSLDVDLVVLDMDMPAMNGLELAERIRADPTHATLPILMLTGLDQPEHRERAFSIGVNDYVLKPAITADLAPRMKTLLDLKTAQDHAERIQRESDLIVEKKTAALRHALEQMTEARRMTEEVHMDTIRRLTLTAEYVDREAAGHIQRIGLYSEVVAEKLGLPPTDVELIRHAAPMHDVGKIGIPREVLMKPGELDGDEWELMKSHTVVGGSILEGSLSPIIQMGERIAVSHHERWDGTGYPHGLAGEAIPLEARICAVVDFFDSLTIDRPHRDAYSADDAVKMMRDGAGTHFDPTVLDAFLGSLPEIAAIQDQAR